MQIQLAVTNERIPDIRITVDGPDKTEQPIGGDIKKFVREVHTSPYGRLLACPLVSHGLRLLRRWNSRLLLLLRLLLLPDTWRPLVLTLLHSRLGQLLSLLNCTGDVLPRQNPWRVLVQVLRYRLLEH